ncbi:hypothetical protein ACFQ61_11690 [Streptomyces sp. NPDC056500]|uniref:hypothetical protein n=1 Tax=Streptomyces sp. NPDC056500 TaxID=3345840 RepID=UPI0036BC1B08
MPPSVGSGAHAVGSHRLALRSGLLRRVPAVALAGPGRPFGSWCDETLPMCGRIA